MVDYRNIITKEGVTKVALTAEEQAIETMSISADSKTP